MWTPFISTLLYHFFYFALGDITVDGEKIDFVEIDDTLSIRNKTILNSCLVSNPFTLTDKSDFTYGVQFGYTDSALTAIMLNENKSVNFKVILETEKGERIGEFDDVTFSKRNMIPYQNQGYRVSTEGIGNKSVRLRLVISINFDARYSLVQKYNTESAVGLGKDGAEFKQIGYKGSFAVTEYALEQNYPNPFNPTTTISYAIPQDGMVTLKIYDALGREVKTLVNEFKQTGRYTTEFDASTLSSGVYIYKLASDKYSSVKKMLLVK